MKILVIGAQGQLGQCLIPRLDYYDVVAASRSELDLSNVDQIAPYIKDIRPQYVINLAAYTAVDKAETEVELAHTINEHAVASIAQACQAIDSPLLHVSTDFVFGGDQSAPYKVDSCCQPIGAYGLSKWAGEQAIARYKPNGSIIIRTAWLYSDVGANFMLSMLRLMNQRDTLGIVSDQIGTPTSAHSLARTIVEFVKHGGSGIYHWTDAGVASWYDFATAIYEEGLARGLVPPGVSIVPITSTEYPTPARRPAFSVLDKSRTYDAVNVPKIHWREELRLVMDRLVDKN